MGEWGALGRQRHRVHELGIAQSILESALDGARRAGAERVHVVRLRLGRLAGVVRESLEFAFEVIRQGTPAAGATIEVEDVPARFRCRACSAEFSPRDDPPVLESCPGCGGRDATLVSGREIEIASIEIS